MAEETEKAIEETQGQVEDDKGEESSEVTETEPEEISKDKVTEEEVEKAAGESESEIKEVKEKSDGQEEKKAEDKKGKDNVIFVGIKPFMNYVTGVVMQFQNKGQDEVFVSARGKFISKAVDAVEVARRTFLKDENIKVDGIKISSEQFENKEGKRIYVSAIEIRLVRG